MNVSDIAKYLNLSCDVFSEIDGVTIDSRRNCDKKIFVAFKGQHVDGHAFAKDAEKNGAVAVLAEQDIFGLSIPVLKVKDCLKALTLIAKTYFLSLDIKVLALTGSNGKTTVKEMLRSIFPRDTYISHGNFNNHLGVPINMMSVKSTDRFAIFELGANHKGDIAHTAGLIQPNIALINNIGPAHIGVFGGMDEVAYAKGEIYSALSQNGIAIVNDDDHYNHFWDKIINHQQVVRFSSQHLSDVFATDIHFNTSGFYSFTLHIGSESATVDLTVPGQHQIQNALAAASMAYAAGIGLKDIQQGLNRFSGVDGRLRFRKGLKNSIVIDDTYNANLESVKAALKVLANCPGKKVFVLGDLAELGDYSKQHHSEIGEFAKKIGIDALLTVGKDSVNASNSFGCNGKHFCNQELLMQDLLAELNSDVKVLIKGSRSAKMDEIVKKISC